MFKVVLLSEVKGRSHPLLDRLDNLRTGQSFSLVSLACGEE